MKKQFILLSSLILLFLSQNPGQAHADGNIQIAGCKVISPSAGDPTDVLVFQKLGQPKELSVTLLGINHNQPFPADEVVYSPDGSTLRIRVARYILITIVKGQRTLGYVGVTMGAPPSALTCNARW